MADLYKYAVAATVRIPIVKRAVVDHAVSADWTPAAGDVKISIDGGAAANVTNICTALVMGNSTLWIFALTSGEMTGKQITVTISDSATKAVEDSGFTLHTYGNASALHPFDLGTASTPQTGDAFARLGAPVGASTSVDIAAVQTDTTNLKTRIPAALTANGNIKASLLEILTTALTETAGQLAGGFKKFFNIATPASTMDTIALVTTTSTVTNDVGITQTGADKVWGTAARTLTSFGTLAADVWAVATRRLSDGTNIALAKGTGITGFTDLSATAVENAVWDAVRASHVTAGTFGQGVARVMGNVDGSVATIGPNGVDSAALATNAKDAIVAAIAAHSYGASYNSLTTEDLGRALLAFLGGKASGLDTGNVIYRSPADDKNVISTTGCTADGNRPNAITIAT